MEKVFEEENNVLTYRDITESQMMAGVAEAAAREMGCGWADGATSNWYVSLFPENRTEENVAAVEAAINGG